MYVEHTYLAGSGPCSIVWDAAVEIAAVQHAGSKVLAQVHTHPATPGTYANPGNCSPMFSDISQYPTVKVGEGPSPADLRDYRNSSADFPSYVVDANEVHVIRPTGQFSGPAYTQETLPRRNDNSCQQGATP